MDRILFVDDERDMLDALRRVLKGEPYEQTFFTCPRDAINELDRAEYALVVSDMRMPDMNGIEFLSKVKHRHPITRRVVLTGHTEIGSAMASINEARVHAYLIKPWNKNDLKKMIHRELAEYKAHREEENRNLELHAKVESETRTRKQLAHYLSPDIVAGVLEGTMPLMLGAEHKSGTVLFCDIVGFTALSDSLGPLAVVKLLNSYFSITTAIVTRYHGTLHKFGGDMIMAFWNVMFPDEHAQVNALRAGIEMQAAVWEFGCELASAGLPPIHVGIGCNTGDFAGGNVGSAHKMEYTVIGDNVNLAQRIENLASRWQVFAARKPFKPAMSQCSAVAMPPALVKGKTDPIEIYSIRGILRDSSFMLLAIPVTITQDGGTDLVEGFLTGIHLDSRRICLRMNASLPVTIGEQLTCTFNCLELIARRSFSARVALIHEPSSESPHCREIELSQAEGSEALTMLRPGALETSGCSWEHMTRH